MNETTILEGLQYAKSGGDAWKHVILGGISGILMGGGLMSSEKAKAQSATEEPTTTDHAEHSEAAHAAKEGLRVATSYDNMSFGDAFAMARAEVGPGGVFRWHGGIYNTYYLEEWNSLTNEQKQDFARQVEPEIHPNEIPTPTDSHPDVTEHPVLDSTLEISNDAVQIVEQHLAHNFDMGEDVHIVGYANAVGHVAVGYDTTGDDQADVVIIDVDDDLRPSGADVIMDRNGHIARLGELDEVQDSNQMIAMENPDVAPDMPDYMNDANIDDINILT